MLCHYYLFASKQILFNIDTIQNQSLQAVAYEEGELLVAFQAKLRSIQSEIKEHKIKYVEKVSYKKIKLILLSSEIQENVTCTGLNCFN